MPKIDEKNVISYEITYIRITIIVSTLWQGVVTYNVRNPAVPELIGVKQINCETPTFKKIYAYHIEYCQHLCSLSASLVQKRKQFSSLLEPLCGLNQIQRDLIF